MGTWLLSMICKQLIEKIVKNDLCTHCGTCIGICPTDALYYEKDQVNFIEGKCINCGRCIKSCPGKYFDYREYNQKTFNVNYDSVDKDLGFFTHIFKVYSKNKQIRENASSGGFITDFLCYLIKEKVVDGVVVTDSINSVFDYQKFITRDADRIIKAAQAKYYVFPGNSVIKEMMGFKGKLAFVGLPCQIQGLRKAQIKYQKSFPEEIIFISLFCGFNMYPEGTYTLINKLGVKISEVSEINYRKKSGENTGFEVKKINGQTKFINKHAYNFLNLFYSPLRCLKCFDLTGEFADISVGDAWEENGGWSRVLIRSEKMFSIFNSMLEKNRLFVLPSKKEDIVSTQKQLLDYKKKWFFFRKKMMGSFPENNLSEPEIDHKDYRKGRRFYYLLKFAHSTAGKLLIKIFPVKILGMISIIFRKKYNEK